MEGALKVQPEQVSEVKPVKTSTSKMELHAEATIREGSVMLSIPETDDDNFIAELVDSKTSHHTYTKEEDKVKRIVMKAAPNMDLDDIKEDPLKKNIVLTNCIPLVDDQVVVAEDEDDLQYMIRKLQEEYEKAGLKMNLSKCEYLIVGSNECNNLPLEAEEIQGVEKCKYLGIILNKQGNSEDEIKERINKGRKVTGALNSLLWDKGIKKQTKNRLYKSLVESVMLYGAEVWDVSKRNKEKLMATEIDFLRRSCGKSRLERVRNSEIRHMMGKEQTVADEIERRQLVWFGHTKRMDENRWPRKVLEWIPPERRKRGRPRRSWRDDVEEAMTARSLQADACFDRRIWNLGTEKRRQP
nr:unnamed protein product [Callosobruchus analis]